MTFTGITSHVLILHAPVVKAGVLTHSCWIIPTMSYNVLINALSAGPQTTQNFESLSQETLHKLWFLFKPLIFCSAFESWLHSLFLWQYYSLTLSPTVLLRMCTVSHPLLPHAHPALTIQLTVLHSLSMHKQLNCILPPTPRWCSCLVTMFLIKISELPTYPGWQCMDVLL